MVDKVQVGSTVEILFYIKDQDDVIVNISTATALTVCLKNPSGVVVEKTASFITDGVDGGLFYKTTTTDLVATGTWYAQAKVTTPQGVYPSEISSFKVANNICIT